MPRARPGRADRHVLAKLPNIASARARQQTVLRRMAAAGDPAFVRIVQKGHLRRPERDLRLIDFERAYLEGALR